MFCTKCGANLSDGAKFCTKCGAPVAGVAHMQAQNRAPLYANPNRNNGRSVKTKKRKMEMSLH